MICTIIIILLQKNEHAILLLFITLINAIIDLAS